MYAPLKGLLALFLISTAYGSYAKADTKTVSPVVVELFQSQGCSSCPPANDLLSRLSTRSDVLTLNFSVTYWDYLGWKDRYARPEFTQRQYDYAHGPLKAAVATPSMILNGRTALSGLEPAEVEGAINRLLQDHAIEMKVTGTRLYVGSGSLAGHKASLWWAAYDPNPAEVQVNAGENNGRTLRHSHIVLSLRSLGTYGGQASDYVLPPTPAGLKAAVWVQDNDGGPIFSALNIQH